MARILCNVAGGGKPLKGNAETGDVLVGKTFSNKQSNALTGSMPNNGTNKNAVSVGGGSGSLWAYMPYGYYDNYNNSGNAWINITNDQAKTLANNAGVGYNRGVSDADSRVNRNSASYYNGYNKGKQAILGGCRIERISMSQYGSHSGTKTFGSNGYIYVAGVLMHGKQVYSGKTATCTVTLNGGVIAQCSATTENNFGDDSPGYSSFSTNFVRYYANNNITASVTGDNGRMACDVFIVFIPD